VELIDQAGALADGGLQPGSDLTQRPQLAGEDRSGGDALADGEVGGGAGLDGIGLLTAEESGAVVFVALRVAARDGERGAGQGAAVARRVLAEVVEEVQQVVGVLAGGIEPDDEGDGGVAEGEAFEAVAELGVAGGGLGEGEFGGGGLEVVAQEGGVVAVARGVDADADAGGGAGGGCGAGAGCGDIAPPERCRKGTWPRGSSGSVGRRGSL
jgi:hypothetical protein